MNITYDQVKKNFETIKNEMGLNCHLDVDNPDDINYVLSYIKRLFKGTRIKRRHNEKRS